MKSSAAWYLATALLLMLAVPAGAVQCSILNPNSAGQNGQTRVQNFHTLVNDLYNSPSTKRFCNNSTCFQVPPWLNSSTECSEANLQSGYDVAPTFNRYLMVADELSELAIVTALADSDARMMEIHNTVQAMMSSVYSDLPCWIAEVNITSKTITCKSQDTASDATARIGLAYYHAANNSAFPQTSRDTYRTAATRIAWAHLQHEYANDSRCYTSSVTGECISKWIGGGGDTTSAGVGGLEMWIGYHQDIVRFLIAAYKATGDPAFESRAREVVDQWLIASQFKGHDPAFGAIKFGWDTTVYPNPIVPRLLEVQECFGTQWAWDTHDAPRALWMGDVLRAIQLNTDGAPLTGAYAKLSQWVQSVHAEGTQTPISSCIQYDGVGVGCHCSDDYFNNGLGAGMHTYHETATLDDKLDRALSQYGWGTNKTWNSTACFGIYQGVRPVKALAAAIGLDAATYSSSCGCASSEAVPAAPSWLRLDTVSSTELKLTWQDNSNNETGFKVERKEGCCGPWTPLPSAPANATNTATYVSTGLKCGTSYAYRVWAYNCKGESVKTNEAARSTGACQ